MGWIDDDMQELQRQQHAAAELRAREGRIAEHAATIFEQLWREIVERIEEARQKRVVGIITNGAPYHRKMIVPQPPKPGESHSIPKEYALTLADDQQTIRLSGPDIEEVLVLALGEDGVVCIRHKGEQKTIPEAVKSLLRPLLFPDLFKFPSH